MKLKDIFYAFALCAVLAACERNEKDDTLSLISGTIILNNGSWGANDSNIGVYSPSTKTYAPDVFYAVNGQKLGDLGQDVVSLGDEIYIAVNGSQTVFVTGPDLKIRHRIDAYKDGTRLSPRSFAVVDGKVYVTYYEGFVGEISSADHSVRLCKVGPNPEGIAVAGGCLYVADSGGMSYPDYCNQLSVVSLESFTEISVMEVNVNPCRVAADSQGACLYVSSFGNYADIPAKLQAVDLGTGKVVDLEYESVSSIAQGPGDILYVLCGGYDENWNPLPGMVYMHDMVSNTPLGSFVSDGTLLPDAYSISVTDDGYVYVGCSDYKTTGDVYVFTSDGRLHDRFDSQGMNPQKAF